MDRWIIIGALVLVVAGAIGITVGYAIDQRDRRKGPGGLVAYD